MPGEGKSRISRPRELSTVIELGDKDTDEADLDDSDVQWFMVCSGCGRWYDPCALPCRSGLDACKNARLEKGGYMPGSASTDIVEKSKEALDKGFAVLFSEADHKIELIPASARSPLPSALVSALMGRCRQLEKLVCGDEWRGTDAVLWVDKEARASCGLNTSATQHFGSSVNSGLLFGNVLLARDGVVGDAGDGGDGGDGGNVAQQDAQAESEGGSVAVS